MEDSADVIGAEELRCCVCLSAPPCGPPLSQLQLPLPVWMQGCLQTPLMRHQRVALAWMSKKETPGRVDGVPAGGILADDQVRTPCAEDPWVR